MVPSMPGGPVALWNLDHQGMHVRIAGLRSSPRSVDLGLPPRERPAGGHIGGDETPRLRAQARRTV
jgi:hypothetical protein